MATGKVEEVNSVAELKDLHTRHAGLTVVLLWAPWHPQSVHFATNVMTRLAAEKTNVRFGKANTDICGDIPPLLGALQVPFVAFLDQKGTKRDSLAGPDAAALFEKVKKLEGITVEVTAPAAEAIGDVDAELKRLTNYSPVMLFMKGSKASPFCKYSKEAVALLNSLISPENYSTFNILDNETVRAELKNFSSWQTYPQLYAQGEFIGGIDVMKEENEAGQLKKILDVALKDAGGASQSLEDRMMSIISQETVMVMMKGDPDSPKCGFSKKIVELLKSKNVEFGSFDILSDEEVRQGLKTFSNWQTYPQLYSHGKLVGGLDIILDLAEEGQLFEEMGIPPPKAAL